MKREIKFRGRRLTGDWYFGGIDTSGKLPTICFRDKFVDGDSGMTKSFKRRVAVDPATVGQFTGYSDCNGIAIYEGDICSIQDSVKAEVVWQSGAFHLLELYEDVNGRRNDFAFSTANRIKVVGNIHD